MVKYVIMGLGSIGSNLLMQLVNLDPKGEFVGVDFDKVEDRNILTQVYFHPHIGLFKAQAMQIVIGMKALGVKYIPINKKLEISHDADLMNWVDDKNILILDCFDNSKSRKLLSGINNCLHVGFSPQYTAEIIWGENYTVPGDIPSEQNDICEVPYAVSFINFVVSLSGIVIKKFLDTGVRDNFAIFDKYKIRKL